MVQAVTFSLLLLLFTGCGPSSSELLKAEDISMVTTDPPTKKLLPGAKVNIKWCLDEQVLSPGIGDGEVGLIDQVVLKANRKYKAAYILKPNITRERDGIFSPLCLRLTGFLPKGA